MYLAVWLCCTLLLAGLQAGLLSLATPSHIIHLSWQASSHEPLPHTWCRLVSQRSYTTTLSLGYSCLTQTFLHLCYWITHTSFIHSNNLHSFMMLSLPPSHVFFWSISLKRMEQWLSTFIQHLCTSIYRIRLSSFNGNLLPRLHIYLGDGGFCGIFLDLDLH